MFNGNGYMVGMHGGWWILLMLVVGVALFYAWQRPGPGGNGPADKPHEVLRRRLASGAITPQQYEEHKALLDRDN
jgi:putative membrane protein